MKKYIYILYLVFWSLLSIAQTETGYVEVKGKIKKNGKALPSVQIDIFENSAKIKSIKSASNGRFVLKLDFDKTYLIEFSKKDFVTKRISFDTRVEEKQYVWPYPFTIELFEDVEGLDVSALKDPVTKIAYSKDEGDFVFDIPYTTSMKAKINKIQEQIKSLKKSAYKRKIAEADKKFREASYEEAIKLYDQAIDLDPYSDYPDERIMECERRLNNIDKNNLAYDKAILNADSYFKQQKYQLAKVEYEKAKKAKPSEQYPKDKIKEIDVLLIAENENKQKLKYNKIIETADALLLKKDYTNATKSYQAASKVLPKEEYPKTKISEIEALLADQKKKSQIDSEYAKKIEEGDRLLAKREYQISKNAYLAASKIKPSEQYPKDKLKEIEAKMADMEQDIAYVKKIKEADALLTQKQFKASKKIYQEALTIKSTESYPKDKINYIDQQLAKISQKAELEKNYSNLIKLADSQFANNDNEAAKINYNKALALKASERYPQDKIKEIDALLADQARSEAKQKQYETLIRTADLQLASKDYSSAQTSYESALKLKPSESYPQDKLKEISSLLADIAKQKADAKAKEDKYKTKIAEGDRLLAKREYQIAKNAYEEASKVKPTENYPKTKIKEIDALLVEMSKDMAYTAELKKGSDYIAQKKYEEAKKAYQKALEMKPNESFPKDKLKAIDALEAKEARDKMLTKYKAVMADAAKQFEAKNYKGAKALYQKASTINKTAQYPKDKIKEIDKLILLAANKGKVDANKKNKYSALIQQADNAFSKSDYTSAKSYYSKALQIFSQQQYPKDKIKEINKLLAETKEVEIPEEIDFSNKEEKSKFISSMAQKYGEGIHEENYESKSGKKVRRIIVVKSGLADEYREVKQPWGATYFFKNGKTVSRSIFFKETQK